MTDITAITNGEAGSSVRTSLNQAITAVNTVGGTATAVTGSGAVVLASGPTLVAPVLGTPASGVATNLTGTASGLTAGHVTTNANLTGVITSSGNATSIASQTGTGTKFVVDTGPTLVAPLLGTPASGVLTNCTGTAAGLTAGLATAGVGGASGSFTTVDLKTVTVVGGIITAITP